MTATSLTVAPVNGCARRRNFTESETGRELWAERYDRHEGADLICIGAAGEGLLEHDESERPFAPALVLDADDGDLAHRRMARDDVLDRQRGDDD
jgi:hypothetical protein